MNGTLSSPEWLRFVLLALAVSHTTGCVARMKNYVPASPVPRGEVLIFGRVLMDPPVDVELGPTVVDAGDWLHKINLCFTETPTDLFERAFDSNLIAQGKPGQLFAVLAARGPLYLRGVHIVASIQGGLNGNQQYSGPRTDSVLCKTELKIKPAAEDQAIYIGLIICHHDQPTPTARVYDEWKDIEPFVRKYTDPSLVKMRFPAP